MAHRARRERVTRALRACPRNAFLPRPHDQPPDAFADVPVRHGCVSAGWTVVQSTARSRDALSRVCASCLKSTGPVPGPACRGGTGAAPHQGRAGAGAHQRHGLQRVGAAHARDVPRGARPAARPRVPGHRLRLRPGHRGRCVPGAPWLARGHSVCLGLWPPSEETLSSAAAIAPGCAAARAVCRLRPGLPRMLLIMQTTLAIGHLLHTCGPPQALHACDACACTLMFGNDALVLSPALPCSRLFACTCFGQLCSQ